MTLEEKLQAVLGNQLLTILRLEQMVEDLQKQIVDLKTKLDDQAKKDE